MIKRYDVMLADPPWEYDNKQQNNPARGGITYPVLTMKELYDIPVHKCMSDNSILIMWVTFPKLVDCFYDDYNPLSIIRAWGFRPVTTLFTWVKLNKSGAGFYSGLGKYTNSNAEIAIVARRGKALPRLSKKVKQLIIAPIGGHSEKPKEQYDRIHALYGTDLKYIEIFARKQNPPPTTWDATGLDYDGIDIREWITRYD